MCVCVVKSDMQSSGRKVHTKHHPTTERLDRFLWTVYFEFHVDWPSTQMALEYELASSRKFIF